MSLHFQWGVLCLCYCFLASALAANVITVDTTRKHRPFIDPQGRERFFHGFNVVYKAHPWFPITDRFDFKLSFADKDIADFVAYGFNVVRLGYMWPGVEPQKGVYNTTYLDRVVKLINDLGAAGIYTILDFHQDAIAEPFCGEGIPHWAVETRGAQGFPWPLEQTPFPIDPSTGFPYPQDCAKHPWQSYQFTSAAGRAYQSLYENYNGVQTAFGNYWVQIARRIKDNPWVLGYEFINEPFAGDVIGDPSLLIPGVADLRLLQPMYNNLNAAIRAVDPDHLIFFAGIIWDDLSVGFTAAPGGVQWANKSVLAYHFYIPPQYDVNLTFAYRQRDMERLQCGGFLTEWKITNITLGQLIMNKADDTLQSWAEWQYKSYIPITGEGIGYYNKDGTINYAILTALSRTYAHAVAGRTITSQFNPATRVYRLVYTLTKSVAARAPTDIYLNVALQYPRGYDVQATSVPARPVKWLIASLNHMHVIPDDTAQDGDVITVVISPK